LTGVIRVALDCADVYEATTRIATRQTRPDIRLVHATIEACAAACVACAEECDRHAAHHGVLSGVRAVRRSTEALGRRL
jgi:hypothetical protein